MTHAETILLGIVQGLTEFLPVSSSGHLVLFQHLLGFSEPELLLDISLHLGTLTAICIYFGRDLREMALEPFRHVSAGGAPGTATGASPTPLLWWVVVGSIPTGLIGLIFKAPLESLFSSPGMVGYMLLATGTVVAVTAVIPETYTRSQRVGIVSALAVGLVQGIAIIPGISRSGITIACALLCGLDRDLAGRFSFLLSIPAVVGALVLQFDPEAVARVGAGPLCVGFLFSAGVGIGALRLLMGMLRRGRLSYFAPYCWAVGLWVIVFV